MGTFEKVYFIIVMCTMTLSGVGWIAGVVLTPDYFNSILHKTLSIIFISTLALEFIGIVIGSIID